MVAGGKMATWLAGAVKRYGDWQHWHQILSCECGRMLRGVLLEASGDSDAVQQFNCEL